MSVAELQLQLHQAIDAIQDQEKLAAVYALLKGSKEPFESMSLEAYVHSIDKARQQIEKGEFLSVDDLEKESQNW